MLVLIVLMLCLVNTAYTQTPTNVMKSLKVNNAWIYEISKSSYISGALGTTTLTELDTIRVLAEINKGGKRYSQLQGKKGVWLERIDSSTSYIIPPFEEKERINFIYQTSTNATAQMYLDGYESEFTLQAAWFSTTSTFERVIKDSISILNISIDGMLGLKPFGSVRYGFPFGVTNIIEYISIGTGSRQINLYPIKVNLIGAFIEGKEYGTLATKTSANQVDDKETIIHMSFLSNPIEESCQISLELDVFSDITVSIYSILGQKLGEFTYGELSSGKHIFPFPIEQFKLAKGMYFAILFQNYKAVKTVNFIKI